jgi:hypothetical protein
MNVEFERIWMEAILAYSQYYPSIGLCGPYTINHVAQSQSAPYTVNHVAQHAMLHNMIDRVWAPLEQASATYGTRAKRGTWNDLQWHAE